MANKFYDVIGYSEKTEIRPGVWDDVITERSYYGDVIRDTVNSREGDQINSDITLGNAISIVADAYANEHIFAMTYIRYSGVLWTVRQAEIKSPRIIVRMGGRYHGHTP